MRVEDVTGTLEQYQDITNYFVGFAMGITFYAGEKTKIWRSTAIALVLTMGSALFTIHHTSLASLVILLVCSALTVCFVVANWALRVRP